MSQRYFECSGGRIEGAGKVIAIMARRYDYFKVGLDESILDERVSLIMMRRKVQYRAMEAVVRTANKSGAKPSNKRNNRSKQ